MLFPRFPGVVPTRNFLQTPLESVELEHDRKASTHLELDRHSLVVLLHSPSLRNENRGLLSVLAPFCNV